MWKIFWGGITRLWNQIWSARPSASRGAARAAVTFLWWKCSRKIQRYVVRTCALPTRNTVLLPAVFLPGSLSREPDDENRGVSESMGEWKRRKETEGVLKKKRKKNLNKKHASTHRSACGCTSGVSSQSADNPSDTTNSTDLHNRAPSLKDYSNPSKFYLSNSLSSLRRREAGNKTSGLNGSSPALPPSLPPSLLLIAPLSPPTSHPPHPPPYLPPLLLCLSPSYSI